MRKLINNAAAQAQLGRAVAAATGPGFKSRQPDFSNAQTHQQRSSAGSAWQSGRRGDRSRVQIPAARFSGTATTNMNSHTAIDARSLAMDRLIAKRLRENPAVLDKARGVLANWMASCDASVRPAFEEWRAILDGPLSKILATLEGDDEKSAQLRQSSPFCGILTPAERTAILMSHAHDQRAA